MTHNLDLRETFVTIERWTDPAQVRDSSDVSVVDSMPASSQLIRALRAQLRETHNDSSTPPELREQLADVLAGKARLSSLFDVGGLTLPAVSELQSGAQEVLKAVEDGELE